MINPNYLIFYSNKTRLILTHYIQKIINYKAIDLYYIQKHIK